jgi:4-diphosphocytidyl-2-C-methyl-D-erythritol kinase
MQIGLPSFAKINLGLRIGPLRPNGFHELRTVYQTIALHDTIRVFVGRGAGVEIRCDDQRVPTDKTNTCYKIVALAVEALKARGRIIVEIQKRLPVQGGLGGASGNAVSALLALELALKRTLSSADKLMIASEVGSDLPLFLIGGTVLGVGRGEEVCPLPDLPAMACVIALPEIAVSTPKAFKDWDRLATSRDHSQSSIPCHCEPASAGEESAVPTKRAKLTSAPHSDRMSMFSREISAWLSAGAYDRSRRRSGVSSRSGGLAENPLLDLVRTGIENDFERVVFPQYPELCEVKSVLESAGARYASLSGSGSAIYGLFDSREKAAGAASKLKRQGTRAVVTSTLTRRQYWKKLRAVRN